MILMKLIWYGFPHSSYRRTASRNINIWIAWQVNLSSSVQDMNKNANQKGRRSSQMKHFINFLQCLQLTGSTHSVAGRVLYSTQKTRFKILTLSFWLLSRLSCKWVPVIRLGRCQAQADVLSSVSDNTLVTSCTWVRDKLLLHTLWLLWRLSLPHLFTVNPGIR